MARAIGTLGTIPSITVGGLVLTDLTNLIVLAGEVFTNSRTSFRLPTASSGYAVTTGKTLKVHAMRLNFQGTGGDAIFLTYSDNDVGFSSATAFTNSVPYAGTTNRPFPYGSGSQGNAAANTNGSTEYSGIYFNVPATKYLGAQSTATNLSGIQAFCYET